jgi:hypothetical protein
MLLMGQGRHFAGLLCVAGIMVVSMLHGSVQQGDLVQLDNGDVLGGVIIAVESGDEGWIDFEHPVLGEMRIPLRQAVILSREQPEEPGTTATAVRPEEPSHAEEKVAETEVPVAETEAPAQQQVEVSPEPPPAVAGPSEEQAAARNGSMLRDWRVYLSVFPILEFALAEDPFAGWKHRLSIGYRLNSGKFNNQELVAGFESNRKIDAKSELRTKVVREYAFYRNTNDVKVVTKDVFRAEMRFRRQWSEDWFIQSNNRYRREPTRSVEHDVNISAGVGYRLFHREKLSVNMVPSITYSYLETATTISGEGDQLLATFLQDLSYRITENWSFFQSFEYNRDFSDTQRDFANLNLRLRAKLFAGISLSNRFEVIYDQRSPANVDDYERRFLTELVYEF